MEVHFFGDYRQLIGQKTVTYAVQPGDTLHDLLRALIARFPALRPELQDERGTLYANLPIFLNGRNPRLLAEGLRTAIRPADVLSVFTPFGSGRINVEDVNNLSVE